MSLTRLRVVVLVVLSMFPVLGAAIAAHAQAAPAAQSTEAPKPATVSLHDQVVFTLHAPAGNRSAAERARRASLALAEAVETEGTEDVRVEHRGEIAVIMAGRTPIVELTPEDASLSGDSSLDVHAGRIASRVRDALRQEKRRSAVASTVFSASLVVFFGLVTLYLIRKLHEFASRAKDYVVEHPDRVPALHVSSLEVMGSGALRSLLLVSIGISRWLGLLGLFYAWLIVSLSLFEATQPYTEKLTGAVISPISSLVGRIVSALPLLVIALVAASAVLVLVRLVALFFASVERGETQLSWLAPEHAHATSWLIRAGLVVGALVFAAPLITGDQQGALTRIGLFALLSFSLGCAPLLASIVVGVAMIYARGLRVGDRASYGGEPGVVRGIGLLALTLEADDGSLVRVPHLRSLWHPTRLWPRDES